MWGTVQVKYMISRASCLTGAVVAALFLSVLWELPASAGVNSWSSNGPFSDSSPTDVKAIAIDPSTHTTRYAGTDGAGVFKTTTTGSYPLWQAMNSGLTNLNVISLAIDPVNPAIIYAGTYYGSVFKSIDGAAHWNPSNSGLNGQRLYSLTIDPVIRSTIYGCGTSGGVWKSIDSGANWNPMNSNIPNTSLYTLAIDPATPATLYAGSNGSGVLKSIDGGEHWNTINNGITNYYVKTIVVDPLNPSTIYAGTPDGLFKSTNGGTLWEHIGIGLPSSGGIGVLAINATAPSIIYGNTGSGVYRSIDGGANWTALYDGTKNVSAYTLAIDPVAPFVVHAGTYLGEYYWTESLPRQYSLTTNITGGGAINNIQQNSPVFTCSSPSKSCTSTFSAGNSLTLHATPSVLFDFAGWSGGGCTTGDCQLTLNSDTIVTATFTPQQLLQIYGSIIPYISFSAAYAAASNGSDIRLRDVTISEDFHLNKTISVKLNGGYNNDFTTTNSFTLLRGIFSIEQGSATINKIIIQ